jgi:quercetin dioxygenase-like cupin family protein
MERSVPVGAGIPIHRHLRMDEAFYVLEGSGIFTLNDARHPFEKGGTIFIPKNAWNQPVAVLAVSYVFPYSCYPSRSI